MNLVTDGFPALALAVDPKAPDLMQQPPRQTQARLLDSGRLWTIVGEGMMLAAIALSAFSYSLFVWQTADRSGANGDVRCDGCRSAGACL